MTPRARLLTKIFEQGFRTPDWRHQQPPPVVTLEEFFEGNTQAQSIAPNLDGEPGLAFFYEHLKGLRSREDVVDVLVNIYDLSDIIFGTPDGWPTAENVHLLTSAPEPVIQQWAEELHSDGAVEGWPYGESPVAPPAPEGFKWWSLTWD
jgi:hypothetical protein